MLPRRLDATLLADLWFFHAVAEAGGFRRAAASLAITQGAVSQRMQRLEARLGLVLMQRGPRGFVLTQAGQQLYAATQQGFMALGDGVAALGSQAVSVRLVAPPSLALGWLLPRLGQFALLHPEIIVGLQADTVAPQQAADPACLRLCYLPQAPQEAVPCWPEYGFPVMAPGAAPASGLPLLHDDQPWGGTAAAGSEWARWLDRYGLPACCDGSARHFNQAQLAYRSAEAGMGVALGRRRLVAAALQQGRLCRCDDLPPLLLGYYALYGGQGSAAAAALAAWLAGELATDAAANP